MANDRSAMFARMRLCPGTINTKDWNRMALLKTLQHEIFHGLGFTESGIGQIQYQTEAGDIGFGSRLVERTWKINSNWTMTYQARLLASPKVREFVRNHFGCPDLEGAELENEGGDGTARTHWEKRIFGGETMSGYISRRSYISELTLSFFEDTGFYLPNYTLAEPFPFGRGKGCVFAKQSCREYMESAPGRMDVPTAARPYCNWGDYVEKRRLQSTVRECSSDLQYYMSCDWGEQRADEFTMDKAYFYDKRTRVGGLVISGRTAYGRSDVLDGCPQWIESVYGEQTHRTGDSVCTNKYSQPPASGNWGAELFGEDSICLKQDGKFEVYDCLPLGVSLYRTEDGVHGAGCYRYKCENRRLMVQANYPHDDTDPGSPARQYKICWGNGTVIRIMRHQRSGYGGKFRFHKGDIVCPDCKTLCENTTRWGKNFKCGPDIRLNSTDYAGIPCPQGSGRYYPNNPSSFALLIITITTTIACY